MNYDKQMLEQIINKALDELYINDKDLIEYAPDDNDEESYHVSERGIVFRFGIYLENIILKESNREKYNIDVEYNRNIYKPKRLPSFKNGVYPDLIIHDRHNHDKNLLIIEFKTWWYANNNDDILKIKEFMSKDNDFKYQFGLSITLGKTKANLKWICETDG